MTDEGFKPPIRKMLLATREIEVNIKGVKYHALLIPDDDLVQIDFTNCPEDDPLRRQVNIEKLTTVDLELDDLVGVDGVYRLTSTGAAKLLDSL